MKLYLMTSVARGEVRGGKNERLIYFNINTQRTSGHITVDYNKKDVRKIYSVLF